MRDIAFRSARATLPFGGRILSLCTMTMALAGCAAGREDSSARGDRWVVVFARPADTLFLDTESIVRVREDVYRAWFRSTRNPVLVREETDCTQRRTRSVGTRDTADLTAVAAAPGPWEELPPGSRGEAYVSKLCEIAPRMTK